MIFGYARVSTQDQKLDKQIDALKEYGCEEIHTEKVSGMKDKRPQWEILNLKLRKGDTLVVHDFDRLARDRKILENIIDDLANREIRLVNLKFNLDINTHIGKLFSQFFSAMAEFERNKINERTEEGRQAAKRRGVKFGRKPGIWKENLGKAARCVELWNTGRYTLHEIAEQVQLARSTVYRYLKKMNIDLNQKPIRQDDYQAEVITYTEQDLSE